MVLKFSRHKLAGVSRRDDRTLAVHGILEDDVYGLEVDLELDLAGMRILSVRGRWNRMENSLCPRAIPLLQEAVGLVVDEGLASRVQKTVGRKCCRQFADLIVECCDAAREAATLIRETMAQPGTVEIDGLFAGVADHRAGFREEAGAMPPGVVIDLHVHSFPASPCAGVSIAELAAAARGIGLDGICLTDHHHARGARELEELRQKHGFLILGGNEITTDQGDILVFGLEEDIKGIIGLAELRDKVLRSGGFMVAAHPFRGFLTFGMGHLGLTEEKAMERPVFQLVDAVEVLNGKVSEGENSFAARVAKSLGLAVTGGSDAHAAAEVGLYATRFPAPVTGERDLVAALKTGDYAPVIFRKG